jgi:hypothetical protein
MIETSSTSVNRESSLLAGKHAARGEMTTQPNSTAKNPGTMKSLVGTRGAKSRNRTTRSAYSAA